jgi:hypothetical protein
MTGGKSLYVTYGLVGLINNNLREKNRIKTEHFNVYELKDRDKINCYGKNIN